MEKMVDARILHVSGADSRLEERLEEHCYETDNKGCQSNDGKLIDKLIHA